MHTRSNHTSLLFTLPLTNDSKSCTGTTHPLIARILELYSKESKVRLDLVYIQVNEGEASVFDSMPSNSKKKNNNLSYYE